MNKLAFLAAAAAAFSFGSAFASTSPATATPVRVKPVPIYVVNPTELPSDALNLTVDLVMTIDANGVPHDIRPAHLVDGRIAKRLELAVSQWRFQPESVNGVAVATRVVLPLTLTAEDGQLGVAGISSTATMTAN